MPHPRGDSDRHDTSQDIVSPDIDELLPAALGPHRLS